MCMFCLFHLRHKHHNNHKQRKQQRNITTQRQDGHQQQQQQLKLSFRGGLWSLVFWLALVGCRPFYHRLKEYPPPQTDCGWQRSTTHDCYVRHRRSSVPGSAVLHAPWQFGHACMSSMGPRRICVVSVLVKRLAGMDQLHIRALQCDAAGRGDPARHVWHRQGICTIHSLTRHQLRRCGEWYSHRSSLVFYIAAGITCRSSRRRAKRVCWYCAARFFFTTWRALRPVDHTI